MRSFIKDDVFSEANRVERLMVVHVEDKSNHHKSYKIIDRSYIVIVWVKVVLRRAAVGD